MLSRAARGIGASHEQTFEAVAFQVRGGWRFGPFDPAPIATAMMLQSAWCGRQRSSCPHSPRGRLHNQTGSAARVGAQPINALTFEWDPSVGADQRPSLPFR